MAIKISLPTSELVVFIIGAFLVVSGAVVTEASRKCYWCGPLAEQVHRSQRAPPCDEVSNQITQCEPSLNYCAIVATSPPYVESRLCVKLYQDECYPLYCNSTKIWKMTCPCQGDLCNGPNTERELESFAVLSKLITKTKNARIYKRTQSGKFITDENQKTQIITNITAWDKETSHDKNKDHITNIAISEESLVAENLIQAKNVESTENTKTEDDKSSLQNTAIPATSDSMPEQITNTENDKEPKLLITTEIAITAEEPKAEIEVTEMKQEESKAEVISSTESETPEMKADETNQVETSAPEVKSIETKPSKMTLTQIKPSETLPTAEALQQNGSHNSETEKPTMPTTINTETTYETTISVIEQTTEQSYSKKNGVAGVHISLLLFTIKLIFVHTIF